MNILLSLLLLQMNRAKIHARSFCEEHLIADDPNDEEIQRERLNKMRLTSPEYFRGKGF